MDRRHFLRGLTAGLAAPALAGVAGRGLFDGMVYAEEVAKTPVLELGTTPKTVVCLGDSVTGVYYHTGGERAYPELLEIALKKVHPGAAVSVVNAGISGNTTENGLARLDKDVLAKKPNLVTVTFGLNDMGRLPAEKFHANLKTIVERCRAVKSEVMLCSTNAVINTSGRPIPKLLEFNEITRKTAAEVGVPFCDTYAAYEALEKKDKWGFRLTLSDEIHPNLDGHKIMARAICRAITGKDASLDDLLPPPALTKTLAKLKKNEAVKVLAMPPYDASISAALQRVAPRAKIDVVAWPVEGKTLPQLDADAKSRVRPLKPDLVVIAVPRSAAATSDEEFVRSYLWVMNWSLGFGTKEWDAIVVHPNVADPTGSDKRDALIPRLVKGQDLWLVERTKEDAETAPAAILEAFLKRQAST